MSELPTIEQAGGIVVGPTRGVLVVTNQIGYHTFPKGSRQPGEDAETNARREIREESGLTSLRHVLFLGTLIRPGHTAHNAHTPSVMKHIDFFHCVTDTVMLRPEADDAIEARWISPDDLRDILTWPQELDFFMQHRSRLDV